MDKQRARNDGEGERRTQEINSNSSNPGCTTRKKKREKKRCAYLQDWLDKSYEFEEESSRQNIAESDQFFNHPSPYWSTHPAIPVPNGQRLFSAVSDPTVCHYSVPSVPLGYSIEPISLPMYTMYPPSTHLSQPWRQGVRTSLPTRGRPQRQPRNNSGYVPNSGAVPSTCNSTHQGARNIPNTALPPLISQMMHVTNELDQEYASLPPETQNHETDSSRHRRFSDPGLGPSPNGNEPNDHGDASSDSESSRCGSTTAGLVFSLVEQVNALHGNNRQLFRELQETRNELHTLKLQAASWRQAVPEYQPGLLSDLVREVRDAARIREDALLARVRHMVGDPGWATHNSPFSSQSHIDLNTSSPHAPPAPDKNGPTQVDERLVRIEEQLHKIQTQSSPSHEPRSAVNLENNVKSLSEVPTDQVVVDLEKEKMQLRCELQEALDSRKDVEVHAQKLERLVGILRKKINGLTLEEKALTSLDQSPSSLENTSESLASVCSSLGSTHSPQVTMSGPVTDL